MRLIEKTGVTDPYRGIAPLAREDSALLLAWWAGDKTDTTTKTRVARILADAAEKKAWIACNCLDQPGSPASKPPVLFPREKDGVFSLQRGTNPGRAEHAKTCPFHWEEGELKGRQAKGNRASPPPKAVSFIVFRNLQQTVADDDAPIGQQKATAHRRDTMQERLFQILVKAGINCFSATPATQNDWERVRAACASITLFDEVDLDDIVWTSRKWLSEGWAVKKLRNLRRDSGWPKDIPMQGFFLLSAKDIQDSRIITPSDDVFEMERPVTVFGRQGASKAPYVTLISAKLDESAGQLRLMRAYAHPRFTTNGPLARSLCPVDSDHERQALDALIYVATQAAKEGKQIVIEKPLADIEVSGSEVGCRPDFLVHDGHRTFCIETMGFADPEYRRQKEGTHALMAKIGPVLLDERVGVEAKQANRRLIAKVLATIRAR